LLPRHLSWPEATYFVFGGGNGIGVPPIPTAFGGGNGIGVPPIPTAFGGGNGIGVPPIPATLRRTETLLSTTNSAKTSANA